MCGVPRQEKNSGLKVGAGQKKKLCSHLSFCCGSKLQETDSTRLSALPSFCVPSRTDDGLSFESFLTYRRPFLPIQPDRLCELFAPRPLFHYHLQRKHDRRAPLLRSTKSQFTLSPLLESGCAPPGFEGFSGGLKLHRFQASALP